MACQAPIGKKCATSSIVHPERKIKAWADGIWDPEKALNGEYGDLYGCPLAALQPIKNIHDEMMSRRK
jgi:hypothetical protein